MTDLAEFKFLDPDLQKCPWEFYSKLRNEAPVYKEPETGFYIVSRYQDITDISRNTAIFSNDLNFHYLSHATPPEAHAIYAAGYERPQTLHRTDPPLHTSHRRLVDRAFTMPRVKSMVPHIEAIVCGLMDALPASGEVDFVADYAIPLPCYIFADLLGMPREDARLIKVWSDALLEPTGMMIAKEREIECARQVIEFQNYFAAMIEDRRAAPRDDILTDLSRKMEGDEGFTVAQVLNVLEQIVTGGNESTTALLAAALLLLIQNPEQERRLREDPSCIPDFIEEILRMESPVQSSFREVKQDTRVGDVDLPKGAIVLLRYGAANRDECRFANPEAMDVQRTNARSHLAFGFGAHVCPGGLLARQEAVTTFQQLLARFSRFELLEPFDSLEMNRSFFLRGLQRLPVRLVR